MTETVLFSLVVFLALLVQASVGFGGALVAMPLLTLFLPAQQAVPTYVMVLLVVDAFLVVHSHGHVEWRRVGKLLIGASVGVPIGAACLAGLNARHIGLGINVVTMVFACLLLLRIHLYVKDCLASHLAAGLLSGVLGGSTSQAGPPIVLMGVAQGWKKDAFRSSLLAYFTFLSIMSLAWFAILGLLKRGDLKMGAAGLAPACLGAVLGTLLKSKLSEGGFRYAVLGVVIGLSALGLVHELW